MHQQHRHRWPGQFGWQFQCVAVVHAVVVVVVAVDQELLPGRRSKRRRSLGRNLVLVPVFLVVDFVPVVLIVLIVLAFVLLVFVHLL